MEVTIPHIIHQIWLQGYSKIPSHLLSYMKHNKVMHPMWKHYFWDEPTILKLLRNNPIYLKTYHQFPYLHQKVDFARYIILYQYGGIYLDMDVKVIKPLDYFTTLGYNLIVSKAHMNILESFIISQKKYTLNNGIIFASPQEPTLLILIKHICRHPTYHSNNKFQAIFNTTGPIIFTKIIMKNLNPKIKILDYEYLEPCYTDMCYITDKTYAMHKHENTWSNKHQKEFARWYFKYKESIYVISLIVIIILILLVLKHKKVI
jgi:mannosyltransferase OCH1-like enzyme